MLTREGCTLASLAPHPLDTIVPGGRQQVLANTGSASGGYADQLFRWVEGVCLWQSFNNILFSADTWPERCLERS